MSFTKSKDKRQVECIVERPDGASYLYFQRFSLQIGKGFDLVEGLAQGVSRGHLDKIYFEDLDGQHSSSLCFLYEQNCFHI